MPPETIAGRYRVEREVGRGGMGSVWLCHDELLGREVAVKQVGRMPGESTTDVARAMREARSSAALNHRNVVAVYDAVEEGEHVWLVMEYVAGRTLSQIVAEDGPLPPERVAWIGAQVADGLAAAHARGTVHRDVKPGNILVTDDDLAKISDFGIARTHGDATLTQAGLVTGTPAYFSPELARGDAASPASDVWALGATLYAAVEGRGAYPEQANALALLTTIATERPAAPARAGVAGRDPRPDDGPRPDLAVGHGRRGALAAPHPREGRRGRHPRGAPGGRAGHGSTAGHRCTAGRRCRATTGSTEVPTTNEERFATAPRRGRRGVLAAVLLLLLLIVGGGYLWWSSSADEPGTTAGESPSGHRSATHHPSPSQSTTPSSTPTPTPTPSSPSSSTHGEQPGPVIRQPGEVRDRLLRRAAGRHQERLVDALERLPGPDQLRRLPRLLEAPSPRSPSTTPSRPARTPWTRR